MSEYNFFGRFNQLKVKADVFNCCDVLDIVEKEHFKNDINSPSQLLDEKNKVDAIFIVMNPGSTKPVNDKDDENEMTQAQHDPALEQIKTVINKKKWKHARVLSLSDIREYPRHEFYKKLRKIAGISKGEQHSIFDKDRKADLEKVWNLKENAPVIAAWGADDILVRLIKKCTETLKNKEIEAVGWLKPNSDNLFLQPNLRIDDEKQDVWVRMALDSLKEIKVKTINEIYREIWGDSRWTYSKKLRYKHFPLSTEYARDFINKFFKVGGRKFAFDSDFNKFLPFNEDGQNRSLSSISLFFLGLSMKEFFLGQQEITPDFRYIWFITSLYHNMGQYDQLRSRLNDNYNVVKSSIADQSRIKNPNTIKEHFKKDGLIWSKIQFNYKLDENSSKNMFEDLIVESLPEKIDFADKPQFFLQVIAKAIEPLKNFDNKMSILKKYQISMDYKNMEINIDLTKCKDMTMMVKGESINCSEKLIENIKELEKALNVDVKQDGSCVSIKIL